MCSSLSSTWIIYLEVYEIDTSSSRLARRGGVKRISAPIYSDTRSALKEYLANVCQPLSLQTICLAKYNRLSRTVLPYLTTAIARQ
jgi:hypothetical protein